MTAQWLSMHYHLPEPFEPFLRAVIAPAAKKVMREGLAESWFFIRYWTEGPHIRFRVKAPGDRVDEVRALLYDVVRGNAGVDPREVPYEPELSRYGGEAGIGIAEDQFALSSETVIELIANDPEWSYDSILGSAIQLHLGFIIAQGYTLEQARNFYVRLEASSLEFLFPRSQVDHDGETVRATVAAFVRAFETQRHEIVPMHEAVWEAVRTGDAGDDPAFARWLEGNRAIAARLSAAGPLGPSTSPFGIRGSYLHMTNNRLGVAIRDEAFLAYLIRRSLDDMLVRR
jgi:thiopeptide-type bacteriocin biosynthesis protein